VCKDSKRSPSPLQHTVFVWATHGDGPRALHALHTLLLRHWLQVSVNLSKSQLATCDRLTVKLYGRAFIINKVVYCPTYNKPERSGITESIKSGIHITMNVNIISLEATFKTVLVSGRTDML